MKSWTGDLKLSEKKNLKNVILSSVYDASPCTLSFGQSLQFLDFVDTSRIPLYLAVGPHLIVDTDSETTSEWFNGVFLRESIEINAAENGNSSSLDDVPWHGTDQIQGSIGVLVKVSPLDSAAMPGGAPRVTEILLYASRVGLTAQGGLTTPPQSSPRLDADIDTVRKNPTGTSLHGEVAVYALPLSSDLIYPYSIRTGPPSLELAEAQFLPLLTAHIPVDFSKKRDRLTNLFDEAADRRKKARRRGGATSQSVVNPFVFQRRTLDGHPVEMEKDINESQSQSGQVVETSESFPQPTANHLDPRRKIVVPPQRPLIHKEPPEIKRLSFSQITSVDGLEDSSFETRNKHAISRVVLAGMRIHGLQQRKGIAAPGNQTVGNPVTPISASPLKLWPGAIPFEDEVQDVEYKGVYHQTYKGTLFAFRHDMDIRLLKPDAMRDTVDKLLAIFCVEPP